MSAATVSPDLTPTSAAAARQLPRRSFLRDTRIVLVRELRPVVRDPFSLVFGLVQPLVFLGLFGPLLAGSAGGTLGGDVWLWFVPAVLAMTTLFGTSVTGSNLQLDLSSGVHERMLVTPLSRPAQLVGRALKEMVPIIAQSAVVLLVMLPFGLRPDPIGAALTLLQLAVLGIGVGSLSYALALAVRKQEWMFWVVQQTVLFPVMLLSGMLLPLETGPAWMRAVSSVNPLRYVVDSGRAAFAGDVLSSAVAWGWVAAVATAALGLAVGVRAMIRSTD
ncbi:ABC-2 type transport system permease protein [Promicromonospora sp. AC04]|uniref:ABC transporter permease n=1 Tax=Promicromonospora sp. AC04 TaxID=2135723 RepID=UPI000D37F255|nr:ABC transporter permease [Promicromonospora sp. AC04]PUB21596.1 ABC-2 type transport system permease protein [Promicromonospora sp. AC04]